MTVPGRDEPDHLPPDQLPPLARRRLDLIADRDLQPRPDEPREVDVEGVVRHPGHRDAFCRAVSVMSSVRAATAASSWNAS